MFKTMVSYFWVILVLNVFNNNLGFVANADEELVVKNNQRTKFLKENPEYRNHFVVLEDGKEYYFSNATQKTWQKACEHCNDLGMKLVSMDDEIKNLYITNYAKPLSPYNLYYWTSGKKTMTEFIWNGVGKIVQSLGWEPGQPNGALHAQYFCLGFNSLEPYYANWADLDCFEENTFVCEH